MKLLPKEEAERFIAWLELQIETTNGQLEELVKIKFPRAIKKRYERDSSAYELVANKLKELRKCY